MTENVIDLQKRLQDQIAVRGGLVFMLCPICKDTNGGFYPVVGITGPEQRTFIANLMCVSIQCQGNTVIDVNAGFVSEDVRILEE